MEEKITITDVCFVGNMLLDVSKYEDNTDVKIKPIEFYLSEVSCYYHTVIEYEDKIVQSVNVEFHNGQAITIFINFVDFQSHMKRFQKLFGVLRTDDDIYKQL